MVNYNATIKVYITFVCIGMYLGFENKEKYRLWVEGVDPAEVKTAEDCSTDAESFSKKLFKIFFTRS